MERKRLEGEEGQMDVERLGSMNNSLGTTMGQIGEPSGNLRGCWVPGDPTLPADLFPFPYSWRESE